MAGKRVLVSWFVLVLLLAGAGSAYTTWRFMNSGAYGERAPIATSKPYVYDVGVFTVDLQPEAQSTARLLRVGVTLQSSSTRDQRVLQTKDPEVRDAVVSVLRSRRPSTLRGQSGMDSLRREIRDAVNKAVGSETCTHVLFQEFVMQ